MSAHTTQRARHVRGPASRYGAAALVSEIERSAQAPKGFRHRTLFSSACRIGELVGGGEISETFAVAQLVEVGLLLKPGNRSEVERAVRAGIHRGRTNNPRSAPTGGTIVRSGGDARLRVLALLMTASRDVDRWAGPAGASDLKVLVGLCNIALHAGKVRVGASYRQIVEASGVSLGTVTRALGALEGRWVLRTHCPTGRRRADRSVFQLVVPVDWTVAFTGATTEQAGGSSYDEGRQCSTMTVDRALLRSGLRDPGHPLWRRRATAWRIWCALATDRDTSGDTARVGEISALLHIPQRTVWRNLAWMSAAGVATSDEGAWRAVDEPQAVRAAAHLEPRREMVRERHRLDREAHRLWLVERSLAGRRRKGFVPDADLVLAQRAARATLARRRALYQQQNDAVEHVIAFQVEPVSTRLRSLMGTGSHAATTRTTS